MTKLYVYICQRSCDDGTQLKVIKIYFICILAWVENVTHPGIEIWIS